MAVSKSSSEAIVLLPDLNAVSLNIVATFANDTVSVSGLIDNVGEGAATGPFVIAIAVTLYTGEQVSSYVQNFEVPANVTIYGRPVALPIALAAPQLGGIINPRPTSYRTGNLEVPLRFIDVDGSYYTAEMLVDPYYQVDDPNRSNNYYTWPNRFWFMSLAVKEKKEPFIIQHKTASRPA